MARRVILIDANRSVEATRLDGIELREAAALLDLSYEVAKKRRRRAEAVWVESWAPDRLRRVEPIEATASTAA